MDSDVCPICLDRLRDEAYLDGCFHSFCFHCIFQWTEVRLVNSCNAGLLNPEGKTVCPLCKASYASIIHAFSGTEFSRHYVSEQHSSRNRFKLSAAHQMRRALYFRPHENPTDTPPSASCSVNVMGTRGGSSQQEQGFRKGKGGRARNQQQSEEAAEAGLRLRCFVLRELQALMQDEDIWMVVQHIIGIVEFHLKTKKVHCSKDHGNYESEAGASLEAALASAVQPFVFEHAPRFATEVTRFVSSGLSLAEYDKAVLPGVKEDLPQPQLQPEGGMGMGGGLSVETSPWLEQNDPVTGSDNDAGHSESSHGGGGGVFDDEWELEW